MTSKKAIVDFEILIDDFFINVNTTSTLTPVDKKKVLSVINDFQDGKWRYSKFQAFIWDNIVETSLSYKDRLALVDRSQSSLTEAAKKLRLTDLAKEQDGQGSELAEIVLYGIGLLQCYKSVSCIKIPEACTYFQSIVIPFKIPHSQTI